MIIVVLGVIGFPDRVMIETILRMRNRLLITGRSTEKMKKNYQKKYREALSVFGTFQHRKKVRVATDRAV